MNGIQNADGHVGLSAREYPVEPGTAIRRGQVLRLREGKAVSAEAKQCGPILGIAAENHPGRADILNPRADGDSILVYDGPGLIFDCPAPEFVAVAGSGTEIRAAGGEIAAGIGDDAFRGGVLRLKAKGAGSENRDVIGREYPITGYSAEGSVFYTDRGAAASAGDVYQVFPPLESRLCALDGVFFSRAVLHESGAEALRVVGHDLQRGRIRLMAALHEHANKE